VVAAHELPVFIGRLTLANMIAVRRISASREKYFYKMYLALIVQVTKSRNGAASSVLGSRTIQNSQHSSYDNAFTPKLSNVLAAGEGAFINVNVAMQSLQQLTGNLNLMHRQPCELGW
jgi:hypothetical protein